MKFKRFFAFFTLLLLIFSLNFNAMATETQDESIAQETEDPDQFAIDLEPLNSYAFASDLEVRAKAAMLIDLNSNTLIYEYEMHKQLYPASLTKIMTCMLAIEHASKEGDLQKELTISETALQNLSEFGSTAGLMQGETLTLNDILYCIMVSSANEGCNVIAEYVSGDIESFVELMNEKAQELGMKDTHFANAHGLHNDEHYTTAYDLSLLARWAWTNERFREYSTATTYVVPQTNKSGPRTLHSTNYLTTNYVEAKYYYPKANGIKTGFTTPAGGCLISTATSDELNLMSIVMGCSPQTADNGEFGDERFVETKKLFEYAFNNVAPTQVLSETGMSEMPEVLNSGERENVVVHPSENRTTLLPSDCTADDITVKVEYFDSPLEAPLRAGQEVGVVTAYYKGKAVASCPAVTLTAVKRSSSKQVTEAVEKAGSWVLRYWYLTIPILLVALLLVILITLRAINVRKAKKRAARRRQQAERRRRRG